MFSFFWVILLPLKTLKIIRRLAIWGQICKIVTNICICKALVMTENLSKTAFSLIVQIGPWSMPGGCEELARGLEPIRNREIFS